MADFVIPVDFRINTMGGQLDIPAGATVHTHPDGAYAGWTAAVAAVQPAESLLQRVEGAVEHIFEEGHSGTTDQQPAAEAPVQ